MLEEDKSMQEEGKESMKSQNSQKVTESEQISKAPEEKKPEVESA